MKGKIKLYLRIPLFLIGMMLIMNVIIWTVDQQSGLIMGGFVLFYSIISISAYYYYKSRLGKELVDYATNFGKVQKKMLNQLEVAYSITDPDGKILWGNGEFHQITGFEKGTNKLITSICPAITRELLQKTKNESSIDIEKEGRFYRVSVTKIFYSEDLSDEDKENATSEGQFMFAFYFFDETLLKKSLKENENQKLVPALVYIDNYEEVLESIEEVKRTLLIALTDRRVTKYFSLVDGIVKKVERDKYFIVFKKQYLEQLEADRFSIIEDVKTIKIGNEMPVTLSIGIGNSDGTFLQKYEYTRAAIDLALGRGGDQVVVKAHDKILYYGGKTQQVEKSTRVKARVKAQALREILETKDQVIIMGHQISDVDSFGAAVGIYRAASILEKRVYIVLNEINSSLRPLMEAFTPENGYPDEMFITSEDALMVVGKNTAVVVVDTNKPSYTECPQLLAKAKSIVVFDHHRQGAEVIENAVLSYIEPYASSTCEMIAEVLQYFSEDIKLNLCEADSIYAGILIDTNNFMTKTGVRTFEAAAYLRRSGAEVMRVRKMLRNDMDAYKARAEAVRNAEVFRGSFAISVCPSDNVESPTIAGAQAANELLNIIGIRASFVLTEYQGKVFISSRSIDEINVQIIMEKLGGGGHLNVAGTQLVDCTLNEAKRKLKLTLDEMLKEGAI